MSKYFSTVMISCKAFLRVMNIIEGPRTKIKIIVRNHKWNNIGLNQPKGYHQSQKEKRHLCPLCFQHASSILFENYLGFWLVHVTAYPQGQLNLTSSLKPPSWKHMC